MGRQLQRMWCVLLSEGTKWMFVPSFVMWTVIDDYCLYSFLCEVLQNGDTQMLPILVFHYLEYFKETFPINDLVVLGYSLCSKGRLSVAIIPLVCFHHNELVLKVNSDFFIVSLWLCGSQYIWYISIYRSYSFYCCSNFFFFSILASRSHWKLAPESFWHNPSNFR